MNRRIIWYLPVFLWLVSCGVVKNIGDEQFTQIINADTIDVFAYEKQPNYRASRTKDFELIHTKLSLSFDWERQHVIGNATLSMHPYFFPQNEVFLDAKGFEIKEVFLIIDSGAVQLPYNYNKDTLQIDLLKSYSKKDTLKIQIEYIAMPNDTEAKGSKAIRSDKGLYFINPKGDETGKPRQIWTQGETESNSKWFPTFDSPNFKTTQEIFLTVDTNFQTLSNGELVYSVLNGDGTRTDYWKQDLPHAPYLAAIVIGEFTIIEDEWRNKQLLYYVEHEYKDVGKEIFNNTPLMLSYFSELLGVEYPWEKYGQVVVRDYVSGAMENTGAVIFGEFVQKTAEELTDNHNDGIVAHELFHHWFGDLVTCESWSNLPLNESFATYGSILWEEYIRGIDAMDQALLNNFSSYLRESNAKKVDLIRFEYDYRDDMFDSHSYAKGSVILHMLRKIAGDEAFFKSLKYYLEKNAFKAVEIHDLRLAFEAITGKDWNWFFNQWFLASGHPKLKVTKFYHADKNELHVEVQQKQNLENTPLYELPVAIDIYEGLSKKRKEIVVKNEKETFVFKNITKEPQLVNFDAERYLLAQIDYQKTDQEYVYQAVNAPKLRDRLEAVSMVYKFPYCKEADIIIESAIKDNYHEVINQGLRNLINHSHPNKMEAMVKELALSHPNHKVRAEAISVYTKEFSDSLNSEFYEIIFQDKSLSVIAEALNNISSYNIDYAFEKAEIWKETKNTTIGFAILKLYAEHGGEKEHASFLKLAPKLSSYEKLGFFDLYSKYLTKQTNSELIGDGLDVLSGLINGENWWIKMYGIETLSELNNKYYNEMLDLVKQKQSEKNRKANEMQLSPEEQTFLNDRANYMQQISAIFDDLSVNETDERIIALIERSRIDLN